MIIKHLNQPLHKPYWGFALGTLDPDPKTTLPPRGLDLDPSCVMYCVRVREVKSGSAMHVECRVELTKDHIESGSRIQIQLIQLRWPCEELHGLRKFYDNDQT